MVDEANAAGKINVPDEVMYLLHNAAENACKEKGGSHLHEIRHSVACSAGMAELRKNVSGQETCADGGTNAAGENKRKQCTTLRLKRFRHIRLDEKHACHLPRKSIKYLWERKN